MDVGLLVEIELEIGLDVVVDVGGLGCCEVWW